MGYFSNGCEGLDWEILWCNRCVHEPPNDAGWDCAVRAIQTMFNYTQLKKGQENLRAAMDMLIVEQVKASSYDQRCAMFVNKDPRVCPNQLKLELETDQ